MTARTDMRKPFPPLMLLSILCLAVPPSVVTAAAPATAPATAPAAMGAEAYCDWLAGCINAMEKDMPSITASADKAAELYVHEGYQIGTIGDQGFFGESYGRSGGMMRMLSPGQIRNAKMKTIVLVALREDKWDETLAKVREYVDSGNSMVIGFGRAELLKRAKTDGVEFDAVVDNHAAPHGGLFKDGDTWVVPTSPTANVTALWVWTGEFVAGCTRRGKMPPMFQGYAVPGGQERAKRIGHVKFHETKPEPVEPGRIGREFLDELRADLSKVREQEMTDIRATAAKAVAAREAGRGVYAFLHGHAVGGEQIGYPHDPGYFEQLNAGWFRQRRDVKLGEGDFVLCIGFDQRFHGWNFRKWDDEARKAGATLAWSFTDYKDDEVDALGDDEIFINQHWAFGDAVATVPGYDIKILPTSGVIADAVLWMVTAEMHEILAR